jgi:hypothetical protein
MGMRRFTRLINGFSTKVETSCTPSACTRRTRNAELAAEVFAAALDSAGRYRPEGRPAAGWLFKMAQNPSSAQETITLRPNHYDLVSGDQGFIAARLLRNGRVSYAQGAMPKNDVPPCFGTTHVRVSAIVR